MRRIQRCNSSALERMIVCLALLVMFGAVTSGTRCEHGTKWYERLNGTERICGSYNCDLYNIHTHDCQTYYYKGEQHRSVCKQGMQVCPGYPHFVTCYDPFTQVCATYGWYPVVCPKGNEFCRMTCFDATTHHCLTNGIGAIVCAHHETIADDDFLLRCCYPKKERCCHTRVGLTQPNNLIQESEEICTPRSWLMSIKNRISRFF